MNDIIYAGKHMLSTPVVRHPHSSWELMYCVSGAGQLRFLTEIIPYGKGSILVIPPFTPHINTSESGFSNIHIYMTNTNLPYQRPPRLQDDANQFLYQTFYAAYYHFTSGAERNSMLLGPYGDLLYGYLSAAQQSRSVSKVVEEIESTIIQNFTDCDFELDSYLETLPLNYDYLRKLFKKEMGITPHKYLSDKRLMTAAEILATPYASTTNIADLAQLCGFREPLYFSRMFKKKFGVAPSYYQDAHRLAAAKQDSDSDNLTVTLDPDKL